MKIPPLSAVSCKYRLPPPHTVFLEPAVEGGLLEGDAPLRHRPLPDGGKLAVRVLVRAGDADIAENMFSHIALPVLIIEQFGRSAAHRRPLFSPDLQKFVFFGKNPKIRLHVSGRMWYGMGVGISPKV